MSREEETSSRQSGASGGLCPALKSSEPAKKVIPRPSLALASTTLVTELPQKLDLPNSQLGS